MSDLNQLLNNREVRVDRFDANYLDDFEEIVKENYAGNFPEEWEELVKNADPTKFSPKVNGSPGKFNYNRTKSWDNTKDSTNPDDINKLQMEYSFDVSGGNRKNVNVGSFWGRPETGDVWTDVIKGLGADSALCIGPRWGSEIEFFRNTLNIPNAIGLDLKTFDESLVKVGDMHDMPFEDNSFDIVYQKNTFNKSYDIRKAMAESVRVLKPGGAIISDECMDYSAGVSELARTNITSVKWYELWLQANDITYDIIYSKEFNAKANWINKVGLFACKVY